MVETAAKKHEETYNQIISFYDFAEALINTVEYDTVTDPASQLAFIEPLVRQIEEATDLLAEEYRNFVKTGKKPGRTTRKKIEQSLAQIYLALDTCSAIAQQKENG